MKPACTITTGYGVYNQCRTKNADSTKAIHEIFENYAETMFKEEPSMLRKTVLGVNGPTTQGYPTMPILECQSRVIIQWKTKTDFATHAQLPYITEFKDKLKPHVATNLKDDMFVYHAPVWHMEMTGTAGVRCYTIVGSMVVKTLEDAQKLKQIHIDTAKEQIDFEKGGTVRYTVFDPIQVKDTENYVIINIAGFKT